MIHLDTNFLIRALVAGTPQDTQLQKWFGANERLGIDSIVWAEFLCGPLTSDQVASIQSVVGHIEPFLPQDGKVAAQLFNSSGRRKGSLADCMIAAVCLRVGATLANLERRGLQALRKRRPHDLDGLGLFRLGNPVRGLTASAQSSS